MLVPLGWLENSLMAISSVRSTVEAISHSPNLFRFIIHDSIPTFIQVCSRLLLQFLLEHVALLPEHAQKTYEKMSVWKVKFSG